MRPLSAIPVSDVIIAIDGPIAMTACVEGSGSACEASCTCPVRGRWDAVRRCRARCAGGDHLGRYGPTGAVLRGPAGFFHSCRIGRSLMAAVAETLDTVQALTGSGYKWGFETDIEMDVAPKGLNEDTIRMISARKAEPEWLLTWRLKAYAAWLNMVEPNWAKVGYPKIDFQDIHYYAAPKKKPGPKSLDEVDPELLKTYAKLGIPLKEQGAPGRRRARRGRGACAQHRRRCRVRQRFRRHDLSQEPV